MPLCPDCQTDYSDSDNYCRKCGMYVAALRPVALVKAEPSAPAVREPRERASLPAPVKKAAAALVIGTAVQIGVSLVGKQLAKEAAKQGTKAAVATVKKGLRPSHQTSGDAGVEHDDPLNGATAVSETVVVRRVWLKGK